MENLPLTEEGLATLGGLAVIIPILVGGLKKMFESWVKGKERLIALALSYILGIAAKLTIENAFSGMGWLPLLIALFFVALGSMITHDQVVNPLLRGKETKK